MHRPYHLLLDPRDRARYEAAATRERRVLSEWMRLACDDRAGKTLDKKES